MSWQTALIGAAGQIAANSINAANAQNLNAENRDWQYRMWKMQNDYNLPERQVERLKAAGINPNLAFGSQASSMSASFSQPSATHYPRYESVANAALNALAVESSVRRQNAESNRQEMENTMFREMWDLIKQSREFGFRSSIAKDSWFAKNWDNKLNTELQGEILMNDLRRLDKKIKVAAAAKTWQEYHNAKQEYDHLKFKYGYEDHYYSIGINPYEPGRVLGFTRSLAPAAAGLLKFAFRGLNYAGGKIDDLSRRIRGNFAKRRNTRTSPGVNYYGLTR